MTVANIGWDMQAASDGRFVVGIGSQVKGHNERRFSVPWTPPAPRMREYVLALKEIWRCWKTGDKLDFEGDHYTFTLMPPNFTPEPIDQPAPPVTIAAVGPAMLKVAGEVCDGARLHPFCSRKYLENEILPRLDRALATSGRDRSSFEITGGGFIATGPDDATVDKMVNWVRQRVGFYGSTRAYWPVFEQHDMLDLGEKLNHMSKTGQWDKMAGEISDDTVRLFAAVGRHDQIAGAIAERFGDVSDTVTASSSSEILGDLPPDVIQDIKRIPSAFKGYATA
jgi:probable F420-dependent oxidoreductase